MKRKRSGGASLVASGRKPILLGLPTDEHDILRRAAAIERRPMTQFLIHYGIAAAKKILEKSAKTT